MSDFARRLTALKEEDQPGELSGRQFSDWLLAEGYLTEYTAETGRARRRINARSESVGIVMEERLNAQGEPFAMVTLTERAQRWLLARLPELMGGEAQADGEQG